ncbi:MAG TPA: hemerythrin domain-containing protein [Bacteroidota bacterium]|jgi:regulator of cell morphogenesis and NO signaling|nr:hemerythrin domain-containing protein [Bacteroidota bacterium]
MKLITPGMKMADVIHGNYLLLPVINRFGIRLGFGEKTVREVCNDHTIDVDFFVAMLNTFSNENYFPAKKIQTFNVLTILQYLQRTHEYYLNTLVPLIEQHLKTLLARSGRRNKSLTDVKKFFLDYKKELVAHFKLEDTVTFPYIEAVYNAYHHQTDKTVRNQLSSYSMKTYQREHTNIDEKLLDLKNILIKYIHGDFDDASCNAIIFELFRLEKDIQDHTRIENNILLPLVTEMEQALKIKMR